MADPDVGDYADGENDTRDTGNNPSDDTDDDGGADDGDY